MSVLNPIFQFIASTFVIALELFDGGCRKVLTPEDWNIYIAGQGSTNDEKLETDTSENDTDNVKTTTPKRTKRIKLLVDIDISPGGSSKVVHVATRNEIMDESPPSWILQFLSKCSLTVLCISRIIKHGLIESTSPRKRSPNGTRRTISPRRRVSQCHFKRFIPNLFPFRCLASTEPTTDSFTIPLDVDPDGSRFFARAQSIEKRKRPESSSSSSDSLYDADECEDQTSPSTHRSVAIEENGGDADVATTNSLNGNNNKQDDELVQLPVVAKNGAGGDEASTDSNGSSSQDVYGSPTSLFKMLNIPEEEYEYESADEDPDYQPVESSSSSSDISSDSDSASSGRKLEQELLDLKADAKRTDEEVKREILEASVDQLKSHPIDIKNANEEQGNNVNVENVEPLNTNKENGGEDKNQNESEYRNGQASNPVPSVEVSNRRFNNENSSSSSDTITNDTQDTPADPIINFETK